MALPFLLNRNAATPTKTVASGLLSSPAYPAGAVAWQDLPNLQGTQGYKANAQTLAQLAKLVGYSGDPMQVIGRTEIGAANEGGDPLYENVYGPSAGLAAALQPYRFTQYSGNTNNGYAGVIGPDGKSVGDIKLFNGDDQGWMEDAVTAVVLSGLTAGLGSALGLGGAGAGSLTGPGSLDAYAAMDAAYGGAGVGGGAAGAAGGAAGGLSGGLLEGIPALTANPLPAIDAYVAANPVTTQMVASTIPSGGLPGLSSGLLAPSVTQSTFSPALDSQAYNQAAGITGQQAANAATVPSTVNLSNAGGTMATAGGIKGMADTAAQAIRDATAGSAIEGGGLLSQAGNTVGNALQSAGSGLGTVAQWMKDNPAMGRLVLGGVTSLLSSAGGDSGSAAASTPINAVKWNSPIQGGLLAPVKQYAPAAIQQQKPAGLLAQGQTNDGAWRYLRG